MKIKEENKSKGIKIINWQKVSMEEYFNPIFEKIR